MRTKRSIPIILLLVALLSACAANHAPKDVQVIQGADTVVTVLRTFSHAVENAAETHLITNADAHQILDIVKAAALTLKDVPAGGYAIAKTAIDQVERTVAPDVKTKIQPYLITIRAALEVYRG